MPILQISMSPEFDLQDFEPVAHFAELAGIEKSIVTIYVTTMQNCFGRQYSAIAHLYLPNLWSLEKINAMQTAATQTLADCWKIPKDQSLVMVNLIQSGQVADRGKIKTW